MNNRGKITVIIVIAIVAASALILYFLKLGVEEKLENEKQSLKEDQSEHIEQAEQVEPTVQNEEKKEISYTNPFGNKIEPQEIEEINVLNYIHWMSHQKVNAENKWGFYEITDERIDWLLDALDQAGHSIFNTENYKEILTRWKNDDFTNIVDDHNYVWGIQGGTDEKSGKATGVLNEEQEQKYIENTEEVNEMYKDEESSE
ncbi:DUF6241 domain-containing protein [Pseudogracilibacillus sp. SE30717A]|uniref:DUF6241 domain-containing protein n=1 Tax=Pseudogracilibacillus sp. SE30717A TaxID=3098293 RepID=UPI00300E033C